MLRIRHGVSLTFTVPRRPAATRPCELPGRSPPEPGAGEQTRGQAAAGRPGDWLHQRGPSRAASQQPRTPGTQLKLLQYSTWTFHRLVHQA